jgi:hypothetical protein
LCGNFDGARPNEVPDDLVTTPDTHHARHDV